MADAERPIIKKRKIVQGDGHHGGAWKVAYADFVTAMMAFFLLMWLLNATTEDQKKGLSDYFTPTIPIHQISGGGDGPFAGDTSLAELKMSQSGSGATRDRPTNERRAVGSALEGEDAARENNIATIDSLLEQTAGESAVSDALLEHIRTRVTDEGLVVDVFDLPGRPLFVEDSALPEPRLVQLLRLITEIFGKVTNDVAITGHLRPPPIRTAFYEGWELSAERAVQAQVILVRAGFPTTRLARVAGEADTEPMVEDRFDIRNARLELVLLRNFDRPDEAP